MKKSLKIVLIVSACLIALGVIISLGALVAISLGGEGFGAFNTLNFDTKEYSPVGDFDSIKVYGIECNVKFLLSTDGSCRVVCPEAENIYHEIEIFEGTLTINRVDNRRFYQRFGVQVGDLDILVYLPESEYESLYVNTVSGDINIPDDFKLESASAKSVSGEISCRAGVSGNISLESTSGEIEVGSSAPTSVELNSTSGSVTVSDMNISDILDVKTVSGDVSVRNTKQTNLNISTTSGKTECKNSVSSGKILIDTTSGKTVLELCDAGTINIKSVSGDVRGKLLSEKDFEVSTVSGDVDVPDKDSGGKCHIKTTSGSVYFTIAE